VKLKLPNKRLLTILGVVALVVIALMVGNAKKSEPRQGPLDSAAIRSCDDFAAGYPRARTKPARLALADRVMTSGHTGNDVIAERQAELGRSAADGNPKWKTSADALLSACRDAGWTARGAGDSTPVIVRERPAG
jgi:hypothetical protein